ncbi:hypothetical protein A2954_05995 [Candidatus Roizmanbacteria bacterium RIFCSPLOWO2_01_FULL_37_12]|uniref:Uncharacterized protein n=1 Tax=Candidatus Roizmanbacteria bacterium RIFCSPLOWO2_01_FULL_37_12 TaxID=1802056 RepID=A0A1F7ICH4_9BACT|nr:MAG: hypothetical protein A2954_05995 [Candidatus Roizmanbacteria bacterium RIFCSPLOWO2_01_FULL_37_12]
MGAAIRQLADHSPHLPLFFKMSSNFFQEGRPCRIFGGARLRRQKIIRFLPAKTHFFIVYFLFFFSFPPFFEEERLAKETYDQIHCLLQKITRG